MLTPVLAGAVESREAGGEVLEKLIDMVLAAVPDRPVSFEVFADAFASMAEQALGVGFPRSERNISPNNIVLQRRQTKW